MKVKNNILYDIVILAAKENEIVIKILIKESFFFFSNEGDPGLCAHKRVLTSMCVSVRVYVCMYLG